MRILIASDLHTEFHMDSGTSLVSSMEDDVDVAVIAGDLANAHTLKRALRLVCSKFKQVVFVHGNHDMYGGSPAGLRLMKDELRQVSNLHWIDNEAVEIGGTRFVGSTLWFPTPTNSAMKMYLNDFRHISDFEPWVYDNHEASLRFLDTELTASDVLVTHQFPFSGSVSPEFLKSPLNCFFHAGRQAEAIVAEKEPFLAIHGHTHASFDYYTGNTRVVCNPHGYPGENASFNFGKIVDI